MLVDKAEWPIITPNIHNTRMAFIDRKSLDNSDAGFESPVNLYQLRGNEKLTKSDESEKDRKYGFFYF